MFADTGISDELAEKIVAFVDREAGRDAPLTAADEAMVRQLLRDDPAVQALADDLRATNAGLDTLLDDVAAVEVPEKLVALIRGHGSNDVLIARPGLEEGVRPWPGEETDAAGEVIDFRRHVGTGFGYGGLAAAASIALFVSCAALLHLYNTFERDRSRLETALATASETAENRSKELADASAELQRLAGLAEQVSGESELAGQQLAESEEALQRLEVERAALQGEYQALLDDNERLSQEIGQRSSEVAEIETARDRVEAELADARQALESEQVKADGSRQLLRNRIDELTAELADRQQQLASLSEELTTAQERSASATANIASIQDEQAALQSRLAAMQADNRELAAERQLAEQKAVAAERQLASVEASARDAENRLATVAAGLASAEGARRDAVQQVFGLEAELAASKSWLGQISQYHRIYASTARRHLVEVGADEEQHIREWLTKMLGRQILIPDLSRFGVTFAGARLLGINEKPVAQLVYLDTDDQPLALCIIPSTGAAKGPTLSTNRDLNLVDWRDGKFGYAVVGWSNPELLASLTQAIRPVYDL